MDYEPILIPDHNLSKGMELHFAPPNVLTPVVVHHMEATIPRLIDLCRELTACDAGNPDVCAATGECVPCQIRALMDREVVVG